VRLVYLSSCYGMATGDPSLLARNNNLGIADGLVHAGGYRQYLGLGSRFWTVPHGNLLRTSTLRL
jgi:hypothetical protein